MLISIGEFIRFFRVRHKMTQQQLADVLGITTKGLRNIGKGQSNPRAETLALVEDYFKIKISRFYPSNTDMLTLETYRLMWEMLELADKGDLPRAYLRANKLERLDRHKNDICHLNIAYVKARYFGDFQGDWQQAQTHILNAIQYADYTDFGAHLRIESIYPSNSEFRTFKYLGEVHLAVGKSAKAIQIFEEVLTSMESILQDVHLRQIFSNLEELTKLYHDFIPELATHYYEAGQYEQALQTIEKCHHPHPTEFKALCRLGRVSEALNLLVDTCSYAKNPELERELVEDFPELERQIRAVFQMYGALVGMY